MKYTIYVDIQPACGPSDGFSLPKSVNEPIQANFSIPDTVCVNTEVDFGNISGIGCDGTTYEDSDTLISIIGILVIALTI